jgi:hypothetical protein
VLISYPPRLNLTASESATSKTKSSKLPMLKLLLWRPSTHQTHTLTLLHQNKNTNTNTTLLSLTRFLSQSLSEDPYDPPFSPTSKPHKPKKKKPNSEPDPKVPIKSDLPFDFRYSYSETNPSVEPIGFREPPKFSPFGPGRLDRKWTGTCAPAQQQEVDPERVAEERSRVLGDPLTEEEVEELVEKYRHSDCARQINLGNFHSAKVCVCVYLACIVNFKVGAQMGMRVFFGLVRVVNFEV